jgi:hypothetical protein
MMTAPNGAGWHQRIGVPLLQRAFMVLYWAGRRLEKTNERHMRARPYLARAMSAVDDAIWALKGRTT